MIKNIFPIEKIYPKIKPNKEYIGRYSVSNREYKILAKKKFHEPKYLSKCRFITSNRLEEIVTPPRGFK